MATRILQLPLKQLSAIIVQNKKLKTSIHHRSVCAHILIVFTLPAPKQNVIYFISLCRFYYIGT